MSPKSQIPQSCTQQMELLVKSFVRSLQMPEQCQMILITVFQFTFELRIDAELIHNGICPYLVKRLSHSCAKASIRLIHIKTVDGVNHPCIDVDRLMWIKGVSESKCRRVFRQRCLLTPWTTQRSASQFVSCTQPVDGCCETWRYDNRWGQFHCSWTHFLVGNGPPTVLWVGSRDERSRTWFTDWLRGKTYNGR